MNHTRSRGVSLGRSLRFGYSAVLFVLSVELHAQTNLFVAADGSARFKTVQEAVMAVPAGSADNPVVIHLKPGVYKERIYIQREKQFFHLVGENAARTVLAYDLHAKLKGLDGEPIGTFRTPSTTIDADDFTAENITFENSAGPIAQALAIRIDGDRAVFRNCRFLGWQDTILANRGRQYFENCYIAGHVDFIFGGATAFFEGCHIHCLKDGFITAASTPQAQRYGFVFSNCKIDGERGVKTYLGRPWRDFAAVTWLNTEMSDVVRPEGWDNWRLPEREQTVRYAEFNSTGPGANPSARVPWSRQLTAAEAMTLVPENVLNGPDGWNPAPNRKAAASATPSPSFISTNATLKTDIEYGQAGGEKLLLDACVPDGDGPFPVAIMVHGGGWTGGDKERDHVPVLEALTAAKFTWFSINYRLAPKYHWPACLDDVETAIRWAKTHAAEYKGDPQHIALIGYSAGGHLVCQAVVTGKDDIRVQAVVGLAPPTDHVADSERRGGLSPSMRNLVDRPKEMDEQSRAILRGISPINFVKPGLPPFLLIQGTADKSVPYEQSVNFQAKLKEAGVPCELITITGAPHRLTEWDKFDPSYREKMIAWLKQTLGITAAGNATSPVNQSDAKIKIVLVGDSTVTDAKGWGPGFEKRLKPGVACVNWAKSGRSSKSYINEGWWEKALAEKPDYVLIQFGHNDMPGKGPDRETDPATTYPQFMARYVDEARAAGAKPVLVTSMTRRHFTPEGKIESDLVPYVEAVKKLAAEKSVPLIDLHARSIEVLDRLGPQASEEFDFSPPPSTNQEPAKAGPAKLDNGKPDKTHLSPKGADVMGALVAEDLKKVEPELAPYIQ
ncbi:MAG TPA: pectinesterase family protein [Verrucomicrobiae bacterium]|nr:pectinesterase family protein [Verrucomicrobiae bacterium]